MKHLRVPFLYMTVFITGLTVLILEILGTRIIGPFYGTTIFVWSSLISVTLGFLALGYWLGGLIADKKNNARVFYSLIFLTAPALFLIMKLHQPILSFTDQFGLKLGPLVAVFLLFSIPLFLLGTVTPFAIRFRAQAVQSIGSTSGSIFAFSTVGSLCGALLAGFFLIPYFSISSIFISLGWILIFVSVLGLLLFEGYHKHILRLFLLGGIIIAVVLGIPVVTVDSSQNSIEIIDHTQSFFGDIKVVDFRGATYPRCLFVNGSGQTCIDEEGNTDGFFQRLLRDEIKHLNLTEESRVLLLGLGGGGILSILPENVRIDIVEIDPEIVSKARSYFGFKERPGVELILDDARHFLATAKEGQYDLVLENIALGSSIPSHLLTQSAFVDMKKVLTPDGVLFVHLGTHEIKGDNRFNNAVYSTAASLFQNVVAISSQEQETANLVLYLSDKDIPYMFEGERYEAGVIQDDILVITDDKNPLDYFYIKNAFSQRENVQALGGTIFYVQ